MGSWSHRHTLRVSAPDVKATSGLLLVAIALFVIACKDGGALSSGGAPVPDAVLPSAIRTHALAAGSGPIENLTIAQVTRASAEKARARVAKGEADDETRTAAQFAAHLDVSPADAANGVEERVGVVWRGIVRGQDGTARDVRESVVATRFQGGLWTVAGYLLTEAGAFAGRGDHAGTYGAVDTRWSGTGSFRCEMDLAPAAPTTFRGTYRCVGRHRRYAYEPYKEIRYEGAIEEFVELAWTPERLNAARRGPGLCCVGALLIARSADGQTLVNVTVQEDGGIQIRWNAPSSREQGPSRTSDMELTFRENIQVSGGGL